MSEVHIQAWKPVDKAGLTVCNIADPDATSFSLSYPGMRFNLTLDFPSLYEAERVGRAISAGVEAGKRAAMAELRAFIGCKS